VNSADLIARLREPFAGRRIIAIAGAPGSGKSTLAERIAAEVPDSALCPMDGYHYDDAVLHARGRRPWKGAPDTFDVGGLRSILSRLKANDEGDIAVPVFDRTIEIARAGGAIIPASARTIVCEGNYMLLNQPPWNSLAPLIDISVMVAVPEDELRRRLTARWVHYGLSPDEIAHKLDGNDLPNGRFVAAHSRLADITIA
jgi:pantothenate kinase